MPRNGALGLNTRNKFQSLHPHARDARHPTSPPRQPPPPPARIERAKAEPALDDPPESSSDDEFNGNAYHDLGDVATKPSSDSIADTFAPEPWELPDPKRRKPSPRSRSARKLSPPSDSNCKSGPQLTSARTQSGTAADELWSTLTTAPKVRRGYGAKPFQNIHTAPSKAPESGWRTTNQAPGPAAGFKAPPANIESEPSPASSSAFKAPPEGTSRSSSATFKNPMPGESSTAPQATNVAFKLPQTFKSDAPKSTQASKPLPPGKRSKTRVVRAQLHSPDSGSEAKEKPSRRSKRKSPNKSKTSINAPVFKAPEVLASLTRELGVEQEYQQLLSSNDKGLNYDRPSSEASPLSSSRSSPSVNLQDPGSSTTSISPSLAGTVSCPICGVSLSSEFLLEFRLNHLEGMTGKMSFAQQSRLHKHHLSTSAREVWQERHYPQIDWRRFPARLASHANFVKELISSQGVDLCRQTTNVSPQQLPQDRRSRSGITDPKVIDVDDRAEDVGYYGGRGARLMLDWIATTFAAQLRALVAAQDTRVRATGRGDRGTQKGVSALVQLGLMPALARRLVSQDLGANAAMLAHAESRHEAALQESERARDGLQERTDQKSNPKERLARFVLTDSAPLGRLLCEEEDERVERTSDLSDLHAGP